MKNSRADRIRTLIHASSIGSMTAVEISRRLDISVPLVHETLKKMDDVYIIDWRKSPGGLSWYALYACVYVPEDAPKPTKELAEKTRSCSMPKSAYQQPRTVWVMP
jgi:hypothetical protein